MSDHRRYNTLLLFPRNYRKAYRRWVLPKVGDIDYGGGKEILARKVRAVRVLIIRMLTWLQDHGSAAWRSRVEQPGTFTIHRLHHPRLPSSWTSGWSDQKLERVSSHKLFLSFSGMQGGSVSLEIIFCRSNFSLQPRDRFWQQHLIFEWWWFRQYFLDEYIHLGELCLKPSQLHRQVNARPDSILRTWWTNCQAHRD